MLSQQRNTCTATLVVVPFVALNQDLLRNLQRHHVNCWEYDGSAPLLAALPRPPSVVVVALDSIHESGAFIAFMTANRSAIRRVVIDECHLRGTAVGYRPQLERLKVFFSHSEPFNLLLLSATLPLSLWDHLSREWRLQPEAWRIVRSSHTIRSNIAIQVAQFSSEDSALRRLEQLLALQLCEQHGAAHSAPPPGPGRHRSMVFTPTIKAAEKVAARLREWLAVPSSLPTDVTVLVYHSDLARAERVQRFAAFASAAVNRLILVGTSGAGTGVDISDVRIVVHFGGSPTLIDTIQQAGRAGRDRAPATAVWMQWPGANTVLQQMAYSVDSLKPDGSEPPWAKFSDLQEFTVTGPAAVCRRWLMSQLVDASPANCQQVVGAALCDVCGTRICVRCCTLYPVTHSLSPLRTQSERPLWLLFRSRLLLPV